VLESEINDFLVVLEAMLKHDNKYCLYDCEKWGLRIKPQFDSGLVLRFAPSCFENYKMHDLDWVSELAERVYIWAQDHQVKSEFWEGE
jgi:hypothetical protein